MQVLSNLNLSKNQIQNAVIHVLSSAPSSPVEGQIYYNSTDHLLYFRNNSTWVAIGGGSGDADTLQGQAGAYYLSRANHTGTQAASTISDLASVVKAYRLDEFANPNTSVSLNSQKITNLATPTLDTDAATKGYVDGVATGLDVKASVRAATTANITLSGTQTIDGVSVIAGDRVLVKDQSTGADNGIYVVNASTWTRATDADTSAEVTGGMFTFVTEGSTNADTGWILSTNDAITLGTTALTFTQFSAAGVIAAGTGLTKTGQTVAIDTASGYGVRKYAVSVGDGSSTSITVTHSLGTRDVHVNLYSNTSTYGEVLPDIEHATTNTVTLIFAVAPTSNQYRCVVIG